MEKKQNQDYRERGLPEKEFEEVSFINCRFNELDLTNSIFVDCEFHDCDLSLTRLDDVTLNDVRFFSCKMIGIDFTRLNSFILSFQFDHCQLNLASFYKMKLKSMVFRHCELQEVDFVESDLSGAVFSECDLNGAIFDSTNLEKADFRTAFNYRINPDQNRIKKARFSVPGVLTLLDQYDIKIEL